ncbi:SHOCT domain-containing protein [Cellulomonas sp. Y8]
MDLLRLRDQLQRLTRLHDAHVLDDDEFAAARARLLA